MLGVIRHQGQDIKRIFQRLETMDESLNTLNQRLETVDGNLNTLKQHLNQIDTKFDEHTHTTNPNPRTFAKSALIAAQADPLPGVAKPCYYLMRGIFVCQMHETGFIDS